MKLGVFAVLFVGCGAVGCQVDPGARADAGAAVDRGVGGDAGQPGDGGVAFTLTLTSPAFVEGGALPVEFTCDGVGHSPPLAGPARPRARCSSK